METSTLTYSWGNTYKAQIIPVDPHNAERWVYSCSMQSETQWMNAIPMNNFWRWMEHLIGQLLYSFFHSFTHSVNIHSFMSIISYSSVYWTGTTQPLKLPGPLGPEELVRWILLFNQNIFIFPPWIFRESRITSFRGGIDHNGKWRVWNHQCYWKFKKPPMRSWRQRSLFLWWRHGAQLSIHSSSSSSFSSFAPLSALPLVLHRMSINSDRKLRGKKAAYCLAWNHLSK